MGADIHIVVEARPKFGSDEWIGLWSQSHSVEHTTYSDKHPYAFPVCSNRNYTMFAHLAGVRDYGDNGPLLIGKPRGLPEDASPLAKLAMDQDEYGYHSISWCTIAEFMACWDAAQKQWHEKYEPDTVGKVFGHRIESIMGSMQVRIIFGFDS